MRDRVRMDGGVVCVCVRHSEMVVGFVIGVGHRETVVRSVVCE